MTSVVENNGMVLKLGLGLQSTGCGNGSGTGLVGMLSNWSPPPLKLHVSSSSSHEAWIISIIGNQMLECCRFPVSEGGESSHSQFAISRNCQVGPVGQLVVRLLQARVTTVGHPEETQGCTILRTTVPGSSGTQAALPGQSGFWDSM